MKFWNKSFVLLLALIILSACGERASSAEESEVPVFEAVDVVEAPSISKGDMVETTIAIENTENWVENATEVTDAVSGTDYVNLDRGVLTVDQINQMLKSLPFELTFADENSQFLYYNYQKEPGEMLAARAPEQVGDALISGHPAEAQKNMQSALDMFYAGEITYFQRHRASDNNDEFIVITYQGVYDEAGVYKGIAQYAQDIQPIVDFYLEQTGMKLVEDPDAVTGATASK